jgi:hypothetical protein
MRSQAALSTSPALMRPATFALRAPGHASPARHYATGERQIGFYDGFAIPCRQHAEAVGQVFHGNLGAQFVAELVGEALATRAGIDQKLPPCPDGAS